MNKNWEDFIKLRNKTDFKGLETSAITLRIPKELRKVLIEDLRTLEDRDEKISFNEYVLLQLLNASNINVYNSCEFKRGKKNSLEGYLKDLEENGKRRKK